MANPFDDPQTHRTCFAPTPNPSSPYPQIPHPLSYPPIPHQSYNYDDGVGDLGLDRRGGVHIPGQNIPWSRGGEEDDEREPLTSGSVNLSSLLMF